MAWLTKSLAYLRFLEEASFSLTVDNETNGRNKKNNDHLQVTHTTGYGMLTRQQQLDIFDLKTVQQLKLPTIQSLVLNKNITSASFHKEGDKVFLALENESCIYCYSLLDIIQKEQDSFQKVVVSGVPEQLQVGCRVAETLVYYIINQQLYRLDWPTQQVYSVINNVLDFVVSPQGDKVATLQQVGILQIWDSHGKEWAKQSIDLCYPDKVELFWKHKTMIALVIHQKQEMHLICCYLENNRNIITSTLSSPFLESPDEQEDWKWIHAMIEVIEEWDIWIIGVSYATDIQVLYWDNETKQMFLVNLEEGSEIACPVDEDDRDIFPCSIALDWTNTSPVAAKQPSEANLPPMPRLLLLLDNGVLKYYSVINEQSSQPCVMIQPAQSTILLNENKQSASLKNPSASLSTFNYYQRELDSIQRNSTEQNNGLNWSMEWNNLLQRMESLCQGNKQKVNTIEETLEKFYESMERKLVRIRTMDQQVSVTCQKLVKQYDQLYADFMKYGVETLKTCENMRLQVTNQLEALTNASNIQTQDIPSAWKEMEESIEEHQHQIDKWMNQIQMFLNNTYEEQKREFDKSDSIGHVRRKIFQSLYAQRQLLESVVQKFHWIQLNSKDKEWKRNYDRLQDALLRKSGNGLQERQLDDDIESIARVEKVLEEQRKWLFDLAMSHGRECIQPQEEILIFPSNRKQNTSKTFISKKKENSTKEPNIAWKKTEEYSKLSLIPSSKEKTNINHTKESTETQQTALDLSNRTTTRLSLNETKEESAMKKQQDGQSWNAVPKTVTRNDNDDVSKNILKPEKLELIGRNNQKEEKHSLATTKEANHSIISTSQPVKNIFCKENEDKPLESSSSLHLVKEPTQSIPPPPSATTSTATLETNAQEESKDMDTMDYSLEKQQPLDTNVSPFKTSLTMSNTNWNNVATPTQTTWTTSFSSASIPSPSSTLFGMSSSSHTSSTPFQPSPFVNQLSSSYQFGSPSSFQSPVVSSWTTSPLQFGVASTATTSLHSFGNVSTGSNNPFASLAQSGNTSFLSSNVGGMPWNPSTSPSFNQIRK